LNTNLQKHRERQRLTEKENLCDFVLTDEQKKKATVETTREKRFVCFFKYILYTVREDKKKLNEMIVPRKTKKKNKRDYYC
jgi:hypothetical protein